MIRLLTGNQLNVFGQTELFGADLKPEEILLIDSDTAMKDESIGYNISDDDSSATTSVTDF